ncbi:hypothetical protein WI42_28860 [Burkholderia ubonensis]|uniref:Uncharacterized protein n=1 Tax=Burkholderia ubonensis TaxID=101571 RepID=A0A102LM12_9BURK|nr:hypothetical protein WI38_04125 [Burkholderia ubonensis]KVA29038.1 hypothetical protein WI42_28860 [Burkholderia ubonensis]KVC48365.1 hypothetical protein WI72_28610 [Burkholderia ubonensis]
MVRASDNATQESLFVMIRTTNSKIAKNAASINAIGRVTQARVSRREGLRGIDVPAGRALY